jgi:hypothetical protein
VRVPVGNGAAERPCDRALDVDVHPVVVTGQSGKMVTKYWSSVNQSVVPRSSPTAASICWTVRKILTSSSSLRPPRSGFVAYHHGEISILNILD